MKNKALFLDRDGVINIDYGYNLNLNDETKLALGLKAGFDFLDVDFSRLNPADSGDRNSSFRYLSGPPVTGSGFGCQYGEDEVWSPRCQPPGAGS